MLNNLKTIGLFITAIIGALFYSFKKGKQNANNENKLRSQEALLKDIESTKKKKRAIDNLDSSDLDSSFDKLRKARKTNNK